MAEEITLNELNNIYGQIFSQNSIPDKQFTQNDLNNNLLYVPDVLPGGISIVDNEGYVVLMDQYQRVQNNVCVGVIVDFSTTKVTGIWKIRYNRGMRGQPGIALSELPPQQQIIKYALIFS